MGTLVSKIGKKDGSTIREWKICLSRRLTVVLDMMTCCLVVVHRNFREACPFQSQSRNSSLRVGAVVSSEKAGCSLGVKPVLRQRCIGPGRARTQVLFNQSKNTEPPIFTLQFVIFLFEIFRGID